MSRLQRSHNIIYFLVFDYYFEVAKACNQTTGTVKSCKIATNDCLILLRFYVINYRLVGDMLHSTNRIIASFSKL